LYVKAEAFAGHDQVSVIIMYDYANIVQVSRNGEQLLAKDHVRAAATEHPLTLYPVKELVALVETIDLDDLTFLAEAAAVNKEAALTGIQDSHTRLGPSLSRTPQSAQLPALVAARAQALTAAASEARMLGLKVPVIAVTGSGNQGITNLLGVLSVAEDLGVSREKLTRALAISTVITVYVKSLTRRLTSFCGAAVAAATGVSAATVYLLGGSYTDMEHAMQSVVGTFAGMLCDGAKESCAFKIAATIPLAIQYSYLALDGAFVPAGDGIVGRTIEETFEILGRLNRPGMVETDAFMLRTIQEIQSGQDA
jgi:L-cysteine desulfidase